MKRVLLTGAGGAIGHRVLTLLMRRPEVERICLLGSEEENLPCGGLGTTARGPEIRCVLGDLHRPYFGLNEASFAALGECADVILHCAERPWLDRDLAASRACNVAPVQTLSELLRWTCHTRLVHLSTTWVAGTRRGLFTEFDLACGQRFCNAFEQSKYEAECLLRESEVADRVTIARRSLVVDEEGPPMTETAAAAADESPLGPLFKRLAQGRRMLLAGDPLAHLDLVPLGYLAEALVALAEQPAASGKTLHLVAGWPRSRPLGEIVEMARGRGGERTSGRVRFVPPALSFLVRRQRALAPYLRQRAVFDDFLARELLGPLGLSCPAPETYLPQALGGTATAPVAEPLPEDAQAEALGLASAVASGPAAENSFLW
ncbi:MAG TPA: SDR family oxidoreductase [Polyangia bacterium]|jgi:nucleoside-diphosphate-sugar epimerase|nr:SDR family oxidoreductase [Polyangia bacterium]